MSSVKLRLRQIFHPARFGWLSRFVPVVPIVPLFQFVPFLQLISLFQFVSFVRFVRPGKLPQISSGGGSAAGRRSSVGWRLLIGRQSQAVARPLAGWQSLARWQSLAGWRPLRLPTPATRPPYSLSPALHKLIRASALLPCILLALAFLIGCSKPATPSATEPPTTPHNSPIEATARELPTTAETTAVISPRSTPTTRIAPPVTEETVAEAASLATEWRSTTEESRRIEILYQLAINSSPAARQTLDTIYHTDPDLETKTRVLEALPLITDEDLTPTLVLLQDATKPLQPLPLRQAAAEALQDLDTNRTLTIWQTLQSDPDPDLRETAKNAIEFLTAP